MVAHSALNSKRIPVGGIALIFTLTISFCFVLCQPILGQSASNEDRTNGEQMLRTIKDDLKKHYFDPSIRGMDLDARFNVASERIKNAKSNGEIFGVIAQILNELNDSHTFFIAPRRVSRTEYGWQMKAVGDDCYVSAVKPGSDAATKGLAVGDKVVAIDGKNLARENVWIAQYLYYSLRPQRGMRLSVVKPNGKEQTIDVLAKLGNGKKVVDMSQGGADYLNELRDEESEDRLHRQRYAEIGDDIFIWKMPGFDFDEDQVPDIVGKFRNKKTLILDLRGNPGGYVKSLESLAGYFFEDDLKIADLKGRKEMKPMLANGRGNRAFKGKLIVLVDSESASAAEVFSRLIQLNNRGSIIGDRSSGKVMESVGYDHQIGIDTVVFYGTSITNADIVMVDGKSLEGVGVTPDELMLPTAQDMSTGRDPVLARAVAIAGGSLDAQKAGALFPVEWKK